MSHSIGSVACHRCERETGTLFQQRAGEANRASSRGAAPRSYNTTRTLTRHRITSTPLHFTYGRPSLEPSRDCDATSSAVAVRMFSTSTPRWQRRFGAETAI